ncbi:inducible T-cell costimulator [Erinaceus europaeus]|uniref:Inducible T-cell costimulator n=1 Tax=Erinaceus europaeus TaxID=9365 RepID=A0A1S2ZK17_ERIEU|nr:inducible T-cell costimulator [Erinaceus europaeus]
MKSNLWYLFLVFFQVEVLTEEIINHFTNLKMFVYHNGGVKILCEHSGTLHQFKMELLKEEQQQRQHVLCDFTQIKGNGSESTSNTTLCESQLSDNGASFFLYHLNSSHAGYYLCRLSIFDPPPYVVKIISKEYLHVYASKLCCHQREFWLPIGCAVFTAIFILGCVFTCWISKKKYQSSVHDPNSEYMFMAAVPTHKKPGLTGVTCNLGLSGTQA